MKFMLDENIPQTVAALLSATYPASRHQFTHVYDVDWGSEKDDPLIAAIADHGYNALITEDRRQLKDHAPALVRAGIHWVGYKSKTRLSGTAAFTSKTATVVAAMDLVIAEIEGAEEQVFLNLHNIPLERGQRLRVISSDSVRQLAARQDTDPS